MKHIPTRSALSLALLLGLAACAGEEKGVEASTGTQPHGTAGQAPAGTDPLAGVEVDVPTAAEAQQQAAQTIDASNADAEFEKLKQEIEGDS